MNNKKIIVIIIGVLVVLIGGAFLIYNKLGDEYASPQLAVVDTDKTVEDTLENEKAEEVSEAGTSATENQGESKEESQDDKTPAVDFTMYDTNGNAVKLSDYYGKPIIMNFWASWCGPCKSEMPDFDKAYQTYGNDINFLMVNLTDGYQETVESASAFISQSGYQFPVYYDSDSQGAYTYGIYSIPTTFFIDKDGNMAAYAQGAINMETLQSGIDMIYSE